MPNLDFSKAEFFAERILVLKDVITEEEAAWVIDRHKNFDELLNDEDNQIIKKLEPWKTSSETEPHIYGTKRAAEGAGYRRDNTKNQELFDFYNWVKDIFYAAGKFYHESLGIPYEDGKYWTDFSTFHYVNGQEMGPHIDYDGELDLAPVATGLLYLNSDKKGGDLYFKDQDVFVESSRGTLVIFPCTKPFYHQSTLITEGEKYHIGSGWKKSLSAHY
jgi:hypothetical protein